MKPGFLNVVFLTMLATLSASTFASGFGPAPHYDPIIGAPASQRGLSVQTLAAERETAYSDRTSYGSSTNATAQAGTSKSVGAHLSSQIGQ
ncbi:hypothetical protein OKW40_001684 [Paraburkholderia sp. RAU6.4a]